MDAGNTFDPALAALTLQIAGLTVGPSVAGLFDLAGGTLITSGDASIGAGPGVSGTLADSTGGGGLTIGGNLFVGDAGTGSLTLNGDALSVGTDGIAGTGSLVIGLLAGSNGMAALANVRLTLAADAQTIVGEGGTGALAITAGSGGSYPDVAGNLMLGDQAGSSGSALIDGATTDVQATGLVDGNYGAGTVTVQNGATFEITGQGTIGSRMPASIAAVSSLVVRDGIDPATGRPQAQSGTLIADQGLIVGDSGTGALLVGASADETGEAQINGDLIVGNAPTGIGSVTVRNNGTDASGNPIASHIGFTGTLAVGFYATGIAGGSGNLATPGGRLAIANGATVDNVIAAGLPSAGVVDIGVNSGSTGDLMLTDPGSALNVSSVIVGDGGTGTAEIVGGATASAIGSLLTDGGAVDGGEVSVGASGGDGTLTVSGAGSALHFGGYMAVGFLGTGTLNVLAGATLDNFVPDLAIVGQLVDGGLGSGQITVDGRSTIAVNEIIVGQSGQGALVVEGGSTASASGGVSIGGDGQSGGGVGLVTVNGPGSMLGYGTSLTVGNGQSGELDVTNGGSVALQVPFNGAVLTVGAAGSGTLDIGGAGSEVDSDGLAAAATSGATAQIRVHDGGVLAVAGNATLGSGGTLDVTGAFAEISGGVSGSGELTIGSGGTLEVDGVASGVGIRMDPAGAGELDLAMPQSVSAAIADFTPGDEIVFTTISYSTSYQLGAFSDGVQWIEDGSGSPLFGLHFAAVLPPGFRLDDVRGQLALGASDVTCFAEGTMIGTPGGERPVEGLRPGDFVRTASGSTRPVRWIGRRRIALRGHERPESVCPVRVRRGAFADNVPHRDLLLSPDHAVLCDGVLIQVRQLVNGVSIAQERDGDTVTYLHVELDSHDILLAEGLAVESYRDTGNRDWFADVNAAALQAA